MSALLGVYERDLVLARGKGSRLFATDGRGFLDFAAGIGVNGLGYGDTRVLAAIRKQAGHLLHASNLFHTEPASLLADRLVALAFPSRVFLCNSGTEAWEGALKFARKIGRAAGRSEFLCFERAFHGRTMGALATTWNPKYREPFEPLMPGVRFLPWDDLGAVAEAINDKTAAVMLEPVQGGLGRTGRLFAFEHAGITPDIVTLAKPLGGGLPMGAILLREELASAISVGDHGSTFGGNPVAAAASLAVLDRLTSPGFLPGVARRAASLQRGLRRLARRYPEAILEVRGLGLMLGVEFRGEAGPVLAGLRERNILATKAGDRVLRLLPPLVIKPGEIREFLTALDAVLAGGAGGAA